MSRGLSRNNNIFIYQHIDQNMFIQYGRYLKSRIYKAYIKKETKQIASLSLMFIKSPYVIYLAIQKIQQLVKINFTVFELGYFILFYLKSKNINFVFSNYRKEEIYNIAQKLDLFIDKVKLYLLTSLIEIQVNYLYYIGSDVGCYFYNRNVLTNTFINKFSFCLYGLTLDLKNCLSYMSIADICSKLNQVSRYHFLSYLHIDFIIEWVKVLNLPLSLIILQRKDLLFVKYLTQFLVVCYCYEVVIMLINDNNSLKIKERGLHFIISLSSVLLLSKEPLQLYCFRKHMIYLLISHGVKLSYRSFLSSNSICRGLHTVDYFIVFNSKNFPGYFITTPSLYNQSKLIQQVSIILVNAKSKPICLVLIRLNKLLLSWSYTYRFLNPCKIFMLLDYLIYTKLRFSFDNYLLHNSNTKIQFCNSFYMKSMIQNTVRKLYWNIIISIFSELFYKQYLILKLVWLLR